MSLINQMLQELEERQPDGRATASIHAQVRAVPAVRKIPRWWMLVIVVVVALTGLLSWMLGRHMAPPKVITVRSVPVQPPSPVIAAAPPAQPAQQSAAGASVPAASGSAAAASPQTSIAGSVTAPSASTPVSSSVSSKGPALPSTAAPAPAESLRIDEALAPGEVARMENKADSTHPSRPHTESHGSARRPAEPNANAGKSVPVPPPLPVTSSSAASRVSRSVAQPRSLAPVASAHEAMTGSAPQRAPVEKHVESPTPQQRAEADYQRAGDLIRAGKGADAAAVLRQVLQLDPGHSTARQTLAGLLVELKKAPEAIDVLDASLSANRGQPGMAMLLARIQLGTADLKGAIVTLEKSEAYAGGRSDYAAFMAALYQRDHRYRESVERYTTALRQSPQNGVWWMGLGISLQAEKHPSEARDAFLRAKNSGTLSPDLLAFVEQQLTQSH